MTSAIVAYQQKTLATAQRRIPCKGFAQKLQRDIALHTSFVSTQAVADTFVRRYRISGFAHGNGLFNAKFDSLSALDAWVEGGRAPASQTN